MSILAAFGVLLGCKPSTPWAQTSSSVANPASVVRGTQAARDLSIDESRGGHTLGRHVGRTDHQLAERLREEPNISAASTYTDRSTAETVVATALSHSQDKITRWLERSKHPNIILDYHDENPVGRTLNRGDRQPMPCSHAIIVLHWDGPSQYHVVTSYPECR